MRAAGGGYISEMVRRFLLLAAAASLLAGCHRGTSGATVDYVVDGDTIDVRVGGHVERVRLIGIDTPEIAHGDTPGECFGPEATEFTAGLLPEGTAVRLERDVVGRDDYGRLLAYVYVGDLHVNVEIVRAGYATPLSIPPNDTFALVIADAAHTAKTDGLGLWSACIP